MTKVIKILSLVIILYSALMAQDKMWQTAGTMKYPVTGGAIVANGLYIYIVGGYSDSLQANVDWIQKYVPFTNSWDIVANLQARRCGLQAGIDYSGKMYIYGGVSDDSVKACQLEVWNFRDDTTSVFSTNKGFDRIYSSCYFNTDSSQIIIVGGYSNFLSWDENIPYILRYAIEDDSLYSMDGTSYQSGSLPIQQMGVNYHDSLYIFGGDYNGVLQTYEVLDPNTGEIYSRVDDRTIDPRAGGYAISATDTVYLIGGYNESNYALSTVEMLVDIGTSSVVKIYGMSLNYARRNLMAAKFRQNIFVFGGEDESGSVVKEIEVYYDSATPTEAADELNLEGENNMSFGLQQNYPNPFNPATNISYSLEAGQDISLIIYNILGQEVTELFSGYKAAGEYSVTWNGKDKYGNSLSSGIYFCRLAAGKQQIVKKMMLLK